MGNQISEWNHLCEKRPVPYSTPANEKPFDWHRDWQLEGVLDVEEVEYPDSARVLLS